LHTGCTEVYYVTHRSHQMQKHKFGVMCPGTLFVESVPVPPENEKWCINISHPKCTEMHNVTVRLYRTQKHTIGVTCPGTLFVESVPVPTEHEK
jgi:hypothetical protein